MPYTILFVEDDWLVAAPAVEHLQESGYIVLEARRAKEALRIFAEHPEIELVATDIGLPEMDGNALVSALRAVRPQLKAIILTGYSRSAMQVPEDQATRYLQKPYVPSVLVKEINALLRDR
jgi:CheY-like chemotaxis protein